MKTLLWPMLIISLLSQAGISVAKWGAYPSDTVYFWFSSGTSYVGMRLTAHAIAFAILWLLVSTFIGQPVFVKTISVKSLLRSLSLVAIALLAEIAVSGAEWFYLPGTFTEGWYQGSFIFFEAQWLRTFFLITSVLFILWLLVARSISPFTQKTTITH